MCCARYPVWLLSVFLIAACEQESHVKPCSAEWLDNVESTLGTGDGMGHGPDIGSGEWRSVVEFKLGIRDDPRVPDNASPEWCAYIDERIRNKP